MPARRDQESVGAHRMSHQTCRLPSKPQPQQWQLTPALPANRLSDAEGKDSARKSWVSSRPPMRSDRQAKNAKLHTNRASQSSPAAQRGEPAREGYRLSSLEVNSICIADLRNAYRQYRITAAVTAQRQRLRTVGR